MRHQRVDFELPRRRVQISPPPQLMLHDRRIGGGSARRFDRSGISLAALKTQSISDG